MDNVRFQKFGENAACYLTGKRWKHQHLWTRLCLEIWLKVLQIPPAAESEDDNVTFSPTYWQCVEMRISPWRPDHWVEYRITEFGGLEPPRDY